jgi:hypothetical protein
VKNKIFKNIKDGRLYMIVELQPRIYTAVPLDNEQKPIINCDMIDFVPVADSSGIPSRNRGF